MAAMRIADYNGQSRTISLLKQCKIKHNNMYVKLENYKLQEELSWELLFPIKVYLFRNNFEGHICKYLKVHE